jgi:hypothetical protein
MATSGSEDGQLQDANSLEGLQEVSLSPTATQIVSSDEQAVLFKEENKYKQDEDRDDEIQPAEDAGEEEPPVAFQEHQGSLVEGAEGSRHQNAFGKEFEEAAAVAAAVTREAAAVAQEKLLKASNDFKGFFQEFKSLSLWNIDEKSPGKSSDEIDIKERFGIDSTTEKILESFRCKLIQQYVATYNTFTPPKKIGYSGQLHILTNHIAFEFDSTIKSVVIPVKDLQNVKQEGGEVIVMGLSGSRELVVGQFAYPQLEIESAMALLESRTGSSA